MSHEYRILSAMLIRGEISKQEFKERIDAEYGKLKQELMNDEITPDQHVERYNELMRLEPQSFGPPELHLCNGCFYRAFPHLAGLFTLPFPVEEVNEETASRRLRREIDEIHALRKLRTLGKI